MKKILILILVILVFVLFAIKMGPFGFKNPKNYTECVDVGGKTNENEIRGQDNCRYNGKNFGGNMI